MAIQPSRKAAVEPRQHGDEGLLHRKQETTSLADVIDTVIDKGVDVTVTARTSLGGVELARIEARVLIASLDAYLRLADAANHLDRVDERFTRLTRTGVETARHAAPTRIGSKRLRSYDAVGKRFGQTRMSA